MCFQLGKGTHIQVASQTGQVLWHDTDQLWECRPLDWIHVPALEHDEVAVGQKESIDTAAKRASTELKMSLIVTGHRHTQ